MKPTICRSVIFKEAKQGRELPDRPAIIVAARGNDIDVVVFADNGMMQSPCWLVKEVPPTKGADDRGIWWEWPKREEEPKPREPLLDKGDVFGKEALRIEDLIHSMLELDPPKQRSYAEEIRRRFSALEDENLRMIKEVNEVRFEHDRIRKIHDMLATQNASLNEKRKEAEKVIRDLLTEILRLAGSTILVGGKYSIASEQVKYSIEQILHYIEQQDRLAAQASKP